MKIDDRAMMEWLFAWEAFRRLGFDSDELIFVHTPAGAKVQAHPGAPVVVHDRPVISLVARRRGKEFCYIIGPTDIPEAELAAAYEAAADAWNAGTIEGATTEAFRQSQAFAQGTELVTALYAKGML